jgi:hypothetical protein
MLVGHFAVGIAAKRIAPKTSLGTLILATIAADVLAWVFILAGIEHASSPGSPAPIPSSFTILPSATAF